MDDLGRTPISDVAPAGTDARYEPEYTALLAEIEKLSSITSGSSISWPVVVESAVLVVRHKSKDFTAMCYLSVGLVETQGLAGLPTGLRILSDFIATFWETGFPAVKRLRGRINALDWWRARVFETLSQAGTGPQLSADLCERIESGLEALDTAVGQAMPDYLPLRDMREAARRLPVAPSLEPPAAPSQPASAPPIPQSVSSSAVQPPTSQQTSVPPILADAPVLTEDTAKLNAQFIDFAAKYAFAGHKANPADPLPWQALRLAVWGKVIAMPPCEGNTTFVPPPDMTRKPFLEKQCAAANTPETLLIAALGAEELFPAAMFWLDLQRFIHSALDSLGHEYANAAHAVRANISQLMERLPDLEKKTFADGTPFADTKTREWLLTLTSGTSGTSGTCIDAASSHPTNPALAEAEKLFFAGDLAAALRILDKALENTANGIDRLPLRLTQCSYLCRSSQWTSAAALADALVEDMDKRELSTWDQSLTVTILLAAREAWDGVGGESGMARAFELSKRLNRLAPSYGIRTM